MTIFCLYGTDEQEKISLALNEVLGFPDSTSYEGGYDIICTLEIRVGCYQVTCSRYFSATGALYRFADSLEECYQTLRGEATYRLLLENDLSFTVAMTANGRATVKGQFQERPDRSTVLAFEMATDQSCLLPVIQSINGLKKTYGDAQGVR